jgi:hypothetical protein
MDEIIIRGITGPICLTPEERKEKLDAIKEALVEMDRLDHDAVLLIYRFLHDALRCRI